METIQDHELMIQGLLGHMTALDHALRLLIASSPDADMIQEAWQGIRADFESSISMKSGAATSMHDRALLQCASRISEQIYASMDLRKQAAEG